MSGWDIDPLGVQEVLNTTIEAAEEIETWGEAYSGHLESAAYSAGTLDFGGEEAPEVGPVGDALARFAENTQEDVAYVAARAGASIQGAYDATVAYIEGDLDMAAQSQSKALEAPDVDLGGDDAEEGD
ncbi:DUF6507 family protein [Yinghuangia sp. ASG 101]|uniref:DUF6507 family protein n=1 Tax=Yinghuangia sp. ASG 101 TaxID=2896848 RepID=UPI001E2F144C|nr:DUF6507 family protein [Yinghuangia sp. ASG 101]UGQ15040.1 DUF6507 family protein [Yinghuangia sp. ASG 101]